MVHFLRRFDWPALVAATIVFLVVRVLAQRLAW
jgi:hypothetical protein